MIRIKSVATNDGSILTAHHQTWEIITDEEESRFSDSIDRLINKRNAEAAAILRGEFPTCVVITMKPQRDMPAVAGGSLMTILHKAYQVVSKSTKAWAASEKQSGEQSRIIVRDLFDAGMLKDAMLDHGLVAAHCHKGDDRIDSVAD